MLDREKVIKGLAYCTRPSEVGKGGNFCMDCPYTEPIGFNQFKCNGQQMMGDALALLKEQEGLLGIQQTADGITFFSTGTAQQGESRGLLLGKLAMHEWLEKELLYRGLLTDDIRAVFDEAKRQ